MASPGASSAPAVSVEHVRKAFGATVAVDDVSFAVPRGSVHALLGENGAGKSTIVKLLAGLLMPDQGQFSIEGQPVRLSSPRVSHARGIQTAFQEMSLVKDLTVLDNILIPYGPTGALGTIRRRHATDLVAAHLATLGLDDLALDEEVGGLELAVQQKIEIARAVFRGPKILLLDEPTSTLSGRDVDWLGEIIARLKADGVTVVFISHRLREVRAFCDDMTVLRNGRHIVTGRVADHGDDEVIRMIAGRALAQVLLSRPEQARGVGPEVLRAERIAAGKLRDASFVLHAGEIVGVAGLQGMGQLDLFLACFGMADVAQGAISIDGRRVTIASPVDAVRADIGISLVPEDRKTEALFLKLSGRHNASLPVIGRFLRRGLIDDAAETSAVASIFERVDVDRRALWTPVAAFSGGNQQKIALAKWLLAETRILLLYDPTRGIDVGTKNELYGLIRAYAEAGGAVLFYSTEIPELVHLADRVLVFYAGSISAELGGADVSEEAIARAALGSHEPGTAA
ncbi:MAG: sugar ABC transporter ATP-binding protein [Methylobacteriaceae bacterium]|nr:sugar ABC transporter ATP-binding protein [Methylobacteriaceae bacterium]